MYISYLRPIRFVKCDWRRMTMFSRGIMFRWFICLTLFQFSQSKVRPSLFTSFQSVVGSVCSDWGRRDPVQAVLQLLLQQVLPTLTNPVQHQQVQLAGERPEVWPVLLQREVRLLPASGGGGGVWGGPQWWLCELDVCRQPGLAPLPPLTRPGGNRWLHQTLELLQAMK